MGLYYRKRGVRDVYAAKWVVFDIGCVFGGLSGGNGGCGSDSGRDGGTESRGGTIEGSTELGREEGDDCRGRAGVSKVLGRRGRSDVPPLSVKLQLTCSQAAVALRKSGPQRQSSSLRSQVATAADSLLQVCC